MCREIMITVKSDWDCINRRCPQFRMGDPHNCSLISWGNDMSSCADKNQEIRPERYNNNK